MFLWLMAIFGVILFFISIYINLQADKTDDISYNKSKNYRSIKTSNRSSSYYSDNRYFLNGKPVKNDREFRQWVIVKNVSVNMKNHIKQLESELTDYRNLDAYSSFRQWQQDYNKYRNYCMHHKLWNLVLGDIEPFIPNEYQLVLEKEYISAVEQGYRESQSKRADFKIEQDQIDIVKPKILDYISSQYGKRAIRSTMLNDITEETELSKNTVRKAYRRLLKDGTIGEKKNENNRYVVRIIHRRKKSAPEPVSISPSIKSSVYRKSLYANVDIYMFDKVKYSTDKPFIINKEKNIGIFTSMADGSKYTTTLESCTCPSAQREIPCKHMVALAVHLGYLKERK